MVLRPLLFSALLSALLLTHPPTAFAESQSGAAPAQKVPVTKQREVEALLEKRQPGGTAGIYVLEGTSKDPLVNIDGNTPLKPASCNKLLTTAAALNVLKPEYRFTTSLWGTGPVEGGVLRGNLIVQGGGDPSISGRFETNKRDVTAILRRWSEALTSAGIHRIFGDVVADDTFFDSEYFHPAWAGGERGEWYSAEVSALAFNDNCVDLAWSSKNKVPGDLAEFRLNPLTSYVQIQNSVEVLAKGRATERYYQRPATLNSVLCTGSLSVDVTKDDSAAVHDGALYFATVFREVLTSQGLTVEGTARKLDAQTDTTAPRNLLFEHRSPPLSEIVNVINRNSQNFYAECVLKTLGRIVRKDGSFSQGAAAVSQFVEQAGIFREGHQMVDGSGLSARNRVAPRQLAELLRLMDNGPYRQAWRDSLPVGQTRGSLKTRFGGTTESLALAPRIMGKTGTIGRVRALSGIINRENRQPLYYSILLNSYRIPDSEALELIDQIAVTLARD